MFAVSNKNLSDIYIIFKLFMYEKIIFKTYQTIEKIYYRNLVTGTIKNIIIF